MSEIARFFSWDGDGMRPANNGDYVRYDDHRAEVERVTRQNSENFAEIERLKRAQDRLRDRFREALEERNNVCYEAVELREKLVEAQAEVERLKEQVAALTVAVEQADEMKANAEAAVLVEEAETDRVLAERNAAQAEVERLKNAIDYLTRERDEARDERDAVQRERERVQALLWLRGRELPTLQCDQSAQNLDTANGQAILDSSRPTDEDIWREAFMRQLHDDHVPNWATTADLALAEYRKRWPR